MQRRKILERDSPIVYRGQRAACADLLRMVAGTVANEAHAARVRGAASSGALVMIAGSWRGRPIVAV